MIEQTKEELKQSATEERASYEAELARLRLDNERLKRERDQWIGRAWSLYQHVPGEVLVGDILESVREFESLTRQLQEAVGARDRLLAANAQAAQGRRETVSSLTFDQLREANTKRLPLFRNSLGEPAHSKPDGSDWSPAQWLQAVVGELGEYANIRKKYERGDIDTATFLREAGYELADVQTYLDILAMQLGIDLGDATRQKFNLVSERVGCDVRL